MLLSFISECYTILMYIFSFLTVEVETAVSRHEAASKCVLMADPGNDLDEK